MGVRFNIARRGDEGLNKNVIKQPPRHDVTIHLRLTRHSPTSCLPTNIPYADSHTDPPPSPLIYRYTPIPHFLATLPPICCHISLTILWRKRLLDVVFRDEYPSWMVSFVWECEGGDTSHLYGGSHSHRYGSGVCSSPFTSSTSSYDSS